MERFDLLIAGAGCAGLSLAVQLATQGLAGRRVLVVDPRLSHGRDRTFCFWDVARHPFEDAVSHRWSRWRVAAPGGTHVATSTRHAYCHLPGDAFYRAALDRLGREPDITVRLGVGVEALREDPSGIVAHTTAGAIRCELAFDGRPLRLPPAPAGEVRLLQHFGGRLVRTEEPIFDPSTVTLMDFDLPLRGAHFMYALPFDEHTALVEDTWMTATPGASYDQHMDEWLRRAGASRWEVLGEERGVLPMTTERLAPPGLRVVPIGLRGGAARPSTGYAFLAIQRTAAELARQVLSGTAHPRVEAHSRTTERLDRIFLDHLARSPDGAPDLFLSLFSKAPADAVVRFLSEVGTPSDVLAVMRACPSLPFARAALRQLPGLLRDQPRTRHGWE
ncbi:MAG: lycopene cyclase [Myxococcales bacterium]